MKRKKAVRRAKISRRFADIQKEFEPVQYDLRYWVIHALHWQAFTCAVIALFMAGFMVSH